jgi:hypothetical protein
MLASALTLPVSSFIFGNSAYRESISALHTFWAPAGWLQNKASNMTMKVLMGSDLTRGIYEYFSGFDPGDFSPRPVSPIASTDFLNRRKFPSNFRHHLQFLLGSANPRPKFGIFATGYEAGMKINRDNPASRPTFAASTNKPTP